MLFGFTIEIYFYLLYNANMLQKVVPTTCWAA